MRLITRSDPDGIISGVFLTEKGIVDKYVFLHPKVLQDGLFTVTENDVIANMPYVKGCGIWFDHHAIELDRLKKKEFEFKGSCRFCPSAAQVIWDYYGGHNEFGDKFIPVLDAVNKYDSGILTYDEILNPEGWIRLFTLLDPRTGLGRFSDLEISKPVFMEKMILYCRRMTDREILLLPDVQAINQRYEEQQEIHKQMLERCCQIEGNILITNLLNEETIYSGNRFLNYVLFPNQNIEIRLMWGAKKKKVVISCGHSIIKRTSRVNVGKLMLKYGGGGHLQVGTCQVPADNWEQIFEEIIEQIRQEN